MKLTTNGNCCGWQRKRRPSDTNWHPLKVFLRRMPKSPATFARSKAKETRGAGICASASITGDLYSGGSHARHRGRTTVRHDQLRRGASFAAMPHRAPAATAGHGKLSASAPGPGVHNTGNRLHGTADGGGRMNDTPLKTATHTTDTPQVLLDHHLKELRLPTILRETGVPGDRSSSLGWEYDRVAKQCAVEQLNYPVQRDR